MSLQDLMNIDVSKLTGVPDGWQIEQSYFVDANDTHGYTVKFRRPLTGHLALTVTIDCQKQGRKQPSVYCSTIEFKRKNRLHQFMLKPTASRLSALQRSLDVFLAVAAGNTRIIDAYRIPQMGQ